MWGAFPFVTTVRVCVIDLLNYLQTSKKKRQVIDGRENTITGIWQMHDGSLTWREGLSPAKLHAKVLNASLKWSASA